MVSEAPSSSSDRLLIVDDDPTSLLVLESLLSSLGYSTDHATSTADAIKTLNGAAEGRFEAVVTDYWMPGGTGIDLLRMARTIDPTLSIVLLTGASDMGIVTEAIREGAHGYLDKPVQVGPLADQVFRAINATRHQRKLLSAARAAQEVGRNQLRLLQHQVAKLGKRLQIHYQPFDTTSGDFVSVWPIDDENFVILCSDTSGHDMKSAYQSSYFHGLARGMLQQGGSVDQVFHFANKMMLEGPNQKQIEISLAALAIRADLVNMRFHCLNAGFPFPHISDAQGFALPVDVEPTNPLGWFPEITRPHAHSTALGHLVFWSDGLDDLADHQHIDPLSLACRLCQGQEDKSKLTLRAQDDIIVVRASIGLDEDVSTQPFPILCQTYTGDRIAQINDIQKFCEHSIRTALPSLMEEKFADITVCFREALINALKHGCKSRPDQKVRVQASYDQHNAVFRLRIADSGPGHDFDHAAHEAVAASDLLTEHRGLVMIKNIPTYTNFSRKGSIVTMEFQL